MFFNNIKSEKKNRPNNNIIIKNISLNSLNNMNLYNYERKYFGMLLNFIWWTLIIGQFLFFF